MVNHENAIRRARWAYLAAVLGVSFGVATLFVRANAKPTGPQDPQSEHSAPQSEHSAPQSEHSAPQSEHSAPQSEQSAPQSEQSAPRAEPSAPQSEQSAPESEHGAPQGSEHSGAPGSSHSSESSPAASSIKIPNPLPQVRDVTAFHRAGQTFVTWREIDPAPADNLSFTGLANLQRALGDANRVRYRIYRSERPIQRVDPAELVAEVAPLSAWNADHFGVYPPAGARPPRYVIEEGKPPLPSGTGLYVYNPPKAGPAYYAVTVSAGGGENSSVSPANTTSVAMESVGAGVPVLQQTEKPPVFQYVNGATLRFYVRWETSANSSLAGKPFDYLVAIPPDVKYPAPVGIHLHCWGGSMRDCFGWWYNAEKGAVFVSSNQVPYDWWTGYHESLFKSPPRTPEDWKKGVIRPYAERRVLSFVDWLGTTMKIDSTRMFVGGNSMGGSGSLMLAIRYPQRFAWAISWVGVHIPDKSPGFKESYEAVYGPRALNLPFEDGTPVWDYFSDVWYLKHHQQQSVGFLTFSNGKNDEGIGWSQSVEFVKALQETKQAHMFTWGGAGHSQRAYMPVDGTERDMPLDLRTDQSLPAFTRCTLDDDIGTGTKDSGAPAGQINGYLMWRTDSIVDEPTKWSMVVSLTDRAPKSTASADVTPRRLQQFKLKPGDRVEWTNAAGNSTVQHGELEADTFGLVTLPQVQISRGGNRITVTRK